LMPRFRAVTRGRLARYLVHALVNGKARRDFWRQLSDGESQGVKRRLLELIPGKSPRDQFLRSFVEEAVNAEWDLINYELPRMYRSIDEDIQQLSRGLPPLDGTVFSVP